VTEIERPIFIRLWTPNLQQGIDKTIENIFNNILEMTMCHVFKSLSSDSLHEWFGSSSESQSFGTGLNITPPPTPPSRNHNLSVYTKRVQIEATRLSWL
jgi:hypothetical protein